MMPCKHAAALFFFCNAALRCFPLHAQIEINIPASKDNTLYENAAGAFSNGAGAYVFVGENNHDETRRALLAFDIAGHVPAGAFIQSVKLTLNMSRTIAGPQTIALHRVLADWGEGASDATGEEGGGVTATTNDATWIHRFFNTQLWAKPGGDFSPTASATQSVALLGAYTWGSTAEMIADVQSWLDAPGSNFGWILLSDQAAKGSVKRFDSRQNPEIAMHPALSVTYGTTSAILENEIAPPETFELAQNHPNPFNPETVLRFKLSREMFVRLQVFDVRGNEVTTLINEELAAGEHRARFIAHDFPSGVYLFRLRAAGMVSSRKGVLLR